MALLLDFTPQEEATLLHGRLVPVMVNAKLEIEGLVALISSGLMVFILGNEEFELNTMPTFCIKL